MFYVLLFLLIICFFIYKLILFLETIEISAEDSMFFYRRRRRLLRTEGSGEE